jgi:hypothetical protein
MLVMVVALIWFVVLEKRKLDEQAARLRGASGL